MKTAHPQEGHVPLPVSRGHGEGQPVRSLLGAELGFLRGMSPTTRVEVVPGQPRGLHCCPLQIKCHLLLEHELLRLLVILPLSVCLCVGQRSHS